MSEGTGGSGRKRLLPPAAITVLLALTALGALTVDRFVEDQERRLLEQRASEATTFLESTFTGLTSTLPILAALLEAVPGGEAALLDRLVPADASVAVAVVRPADDGGGFVVVAGAVDGAAAGQAIDADRLALLARAAEAEGIAATVVAASDGRRLVSAVGLASGGALLQELVIGDDVIDRGEDEDGPFRDLDGAVYAASEVDPSRLVFATTPSLPIGGDAILHPLSIGLDTWTLEVRARDPLVGTLASNAPLFTLGVGAVLALLVGMVLEILNRRRVYALQLVDERTAELRAALDEQHRLQVSQRVALEVAESANRSKSEFLSRMSHELRTPLNAVLGFAQLLEDDDLTPDGQDSVHQILKGGRHLLGLINELLDITRIESGSFQLSPEPTDPNEVVADISQLAAPLAERAGIRVVTEPSIDDVHVLADRQRLTQVLLNLVANAIKYNRVAGTVTLACERVEPARLRILVRDTGPGIPPDQIDLLFVPFERLGAEQTAIEGTGIGLALSRRLAEAMGGTLDLETTLGVGSTFWIELPIVESPLDRYLRLEGEPAPAESEASGELIRRVLYIEDNMANLRLVERVLGDDPSTRLLSTGHGRLGIELAREHRPSVILLDLHLPDMDGDEVLRILRDDPETASIPVVIVSADATTGQATRLLAEGARAFVTKPIDVRELRSIIEGISVTPG